MKMLTMAMTPQQEAEYALSNGLARSTLSPSAQAEYDRLAEAYEQARQQRREVQSRELTEARQIIRGTAWFPELGVAVRDGKVYRHGVARNGGLSHMQEVRERKGEEMRLLGVLAGAHAEAISGKAGSRRSGGQRIADAALAAHLVGPLGLLAVASRAGSGAMLVVFADGSSTPTIVLSDAASVTRAQVAAAQFNAMAAAAASAETPAAPLPEASAGRIAAELERLAALHASGALDDEEFRAAKARVIGG